MFKIKPLPKSSWPIGLKNIPCPPERLWIRGYESFLKLRSDGYKFLTVVGSRKFTEYGEMACREVISGLRNYKICVVSGLAYGIDSLAHRTALDNDIPTIAFPGSGLDNNFIYPRAHLELAQEILRNNGCLISEFDHNQDTRPWMFPQRNRLMVGICDAALIIEAGEKSGSGITANMTIEYDRDLLAIPGSIFNHNSRMTNRLIKNGAALVSNSDDILENMNFKNLFENKNETGKHSDNIRRNNLNTLERSVLKFIQNGMTDQEEIMNEMKIPISELNRVISKLEIEDLI